MLAGSTASNTHPSGTQDGTNAAWRQCARRHAYGKPPIRKRCDGASRATCPPHANPMSVTTGSMTDTHATRCGSTTQARGKASSRKTGSTHADSMTSYGMTLPYRLQQATRQAMRHAYMPHTPRANGKQRDKQTCRRQCTTTT